jgi:predicted negative regulator of RcsB-dependent stress response
MKSISLVIVIVLNLVIVGQASPSERMLVSAEALFKSKRYLEARSVFHQAYLLNKKGPLAEKALVGVGKSDYYLRRYYEARQSLNRVLSMSQDPELLNEANYYLGLVALSLYNYRLADRYLSNVTGGLKVPAAIAMAEAAVRANQISQAETLLKTLKSSDFEVYPRGIAVRAMLDSVKGRHEKAVFAINRLDEKTLQDLDMVVEKGQILYYADRLKEAETQLNKIVSAPGTTNINRLRALKVLWYIYTKEDRVDDAIRVGNTLLAYDNSDDFKVNLARLYDKKGDMANALRVLSYIDSKKVREIEYDKRFRVLFAKKDPALTSYIYKYGNFVSLNSPLLVDMARHLVAQNNDKKGAIEMLRRASRGAAAGAASLYMAELLLEEKRFTEAKRALDYLTLDPRYARTATLMLGEIIEKEGNIRAALSYYKKVFETTRDARLAERIGDILWGQGNRDEAVKYYVIASAGGNLSAAVKAGDFYYIKGDRKNAMEFYKKGLKIGKDRPEYAWINYQYGKLTGNKEYLANAAKAGQGEIAEAAKILLKEF